MLYVIATPIGNLEDITLRALRTLREVDLILCEDTRVTKRLLDHYDIKKPSLSFHQHSKLHRIEEIIKMLKQGSNIALVSDAGTPGISDPAAKLISRLHEENYFNISPIPGPSAVTTALSVSGVFGSEFLFLGFLPHKKGRQTLLKKISEFDGAVALYESPYRIKKLLSELSQFLDPKKKVVVFRELTKKFESIYYGTVQGLVQQDIRAQGEFVVIIKPC